MDVLLGGKSPLIGQATCVSRLGPSPASKGKWVDVFADGRQGSWAEGSTVGRLVQAPAGPSTLEGHTAKWVRGKVKGGQSDTFHGISEWTPHRTSEPGPRAAQDGLATWRESFLPLEPTRREQAPHCGHGALSSSFPSVPAHRGTEGGGRLNKAVPQRSHQPLPLFPLPSAWPWGNYGRGEIRNSSPATLRQWLRSCFGSAPGTPSSVPVLCSRSACVRPQTDHSSLFSVIACLAFALNHMLPERRAHLSCWLLQVDVNWLVSH